MAYSENRGTPTTEQPVPKKKKKTGCFLAIIAYLIFAFLFYYSIYKFVMSGHHDGTEAADTEYWGTKTENAEGFTELISYKE